MAVHADGVNLVAGGFDRGLRGGVHRFAPRDSIRIIDLQEVYRFLVKTQFRAGLPVPIFKYACAFEGYMAFNLRLIFFKIGDRLSMADLKGDPMGEIALEVSTRWGAQYHSWLGYGPLHYE